MQPQPPSVQESWDLQKGASTDAPSFPRHIHELAALSAGTAGMGPSHRVYNEIKHMQTFILFKIMRQGRFCQITTFILLCVVSSVLSVREIP